MGGDTNERHDRYDFPRVRKHDHGVEGAAGASHRRGLAGLAAATALAACAPPALERTDLVVEATTSTAPATSTTAPDPAALRLGQRTTTREGNDVEVTAFVQPVSPGVLQPDRGMEFAAAEARICAGPRGARRVTAESFRIEMADGTTRGRSFLGPKEPALTEARLGGGECVRGWVNFEVPEGERPAHVVFQGSSVARWNAGR